MATGGKFTPTRTGRSGSLARCVPKHMRTCCVSSRSTESRAPPRPRALSPPGGGGSPESGRRGPEYFAPPVPSVVRSATLWAGAPRPMTPCPPRIPPGATSAGGPRAGATPDPRGPQPGLGGRRAAGYANARGGGRGPPPAADKGWRAGRRAEAAASREPAVRSGPRPPAARPRGRRLPVRTRGGPGTRGGGGGSWGGGAGTRGPARAAPRARVALSRREPGTWRLGGALPGAGRRWRLPSLCAGPVCPRAMPVETERSCVRRARSSRGLRVSRSGVGWGSEEEQLPGGAPLAVTPFLASVPGTLCGAMGRESAPRGRRCGCAHV